MASQHGLDVGMKCVKYMLFVANLMFVLIAFLLISIGSTVKTIYKDFDEFMSNHYYSPSTLAIVVGFFIFMVALFGCVGAIKESTFLVNVYAFCLACVLILEISVSIASYAMRDNIEQTIEQNMRVAMDKYYVDEHYAYAWNSTQEVLRCCGIHSANDWSPAHHKNNVTLPDSCCLNSDCSTGNYYGTGCLNKLAYIVSECSLLLAVGALCVSFIQVLGIIFAHMLAKSIRKIKTQALVDKELKRQQFYENLTYNLPSAKDKEKENKNSTAEFAVPGSSEA